MTDLSNIVVALVSGVAGGSTALLGQYASQRANRQQHLEELRQRSVELLASFTLPVTTRRAEALQELFTSLQEVMDNQKFSVDDYDLIRQRLIFVPSSISEELLSALSALVSGGRANDQSQIELARSRLRLVQESIRNAIGLGSIDNYVRQLNELQAETRAAA